MLQMSSLGLSSCDPDVEREGPSGILANIIALATAKAPEMEIFPQGTVLVVAEEGLARCAYLIEINIFSSVKND